MRFTLHRERLGPLPIVNHCLEKLGLEALLDQFVPTTDRRCTLPYAKGLGVLLRSIIVEREPVYRQQETVQDFAPSVFGLTAKQARQLRDDQLGRALDRLFDADRGSLLTAVVLAAVRQFRLRFRELHNDSTSVSFTGQYRGARGRQLRGRRAPWITYGHSKDHRPDLKQLLFILSVSTDGGVPVQFRCADGQTNDSRTHLETWEALRQVAGRPDFLYVADSKLCGGEAMHAIDRQGGRFVTVLPRSRKEDAGFREWIQTHEPRWELLWDRPHPRRQDGPRDVWRVFRDPLPSRENWPVSWVSSALLALQHEQGRRERLVRAVQELERLRDKLAGPRPRLHSKPQAQRKVDELLGRLRVARYLRARVVEQQEHRFRQEHRGRPGTQTRYRRITRRRLVVEWEFDEAGIAYDQKTDGMYPLLSNDRSLTPAQVLEAHKRQPVLEKRFEQIKTVHEIAPVFLKNEGRIEALFFLYFLGLFTQALIERELRAAMKRERTTSLPLYPEQRACRRPTSEQVLRLFSLTERSILLRGGRTLQVFDPEWTPLQRQALSLLGVPMRVYRSR
ncbi:MAG: IS1634 family transposase [Candidatus Eisenbacteria bacterium]